MGRGTCLAKRQGRGYGTGAEDGELWAETVRRGAVNRGGLRTQRPPGHGGSGCGMARGPVCRLDGEGVFEFLHPRLQILDFALLLFQEQVFNAV
jgi:hypothetical protein